MTRDEILTLARKHDAQAEWATDEPDENRLLVLPNAIVFLLDRDPDAYEEPNQFPTEHTVLVFPHLNERN